MGRNPVWGNESWNEPNAQTRKFEPNPKIYLRLWEIAKYSNGAENLTYWNKSSSLVTENQGTWHLPHKGMWLQSHIMYIYPITVRAEIKADSIACIQMALFYRNLGEVNKKIRVTTERDLVIPRPGTWKEKISNNTDWQTLMIVVTPQKFIHWYIAFREIFLQIPVSVQGFIGFHAACGGMKVRNVFIEPYNGLHVNEKDSAPCGYLSETDVSKTKNCDLGAVCNCNEGKPYVVQHCKCKAAPKKSKVVVVIVSLVIIFVLLIVFLLAFRYFNKKKGRGDEERGDQTEKV